MNRRNLALDGLRAFAIIPVILIHFCITAKGPDWLQRGTSFGWYGVDLFFVLSGFLITSILLRTSGSEHWYRTFIVRRALRLFPLYYAVLGFVIIGAYHGQKWDALLHWGPGWLVVYLGNFRAAILNFLPPIFSLGPLWSLQVEEQFYVLFPLLVAFTTLTSLRRTLTALLVLAPLSRLALTVHSPGPVLGCYVLPFCRMDALAWGGILAVLKTEDKVPSLATLRSIALTGIGLSAGLFWIFSPDELQPVIRTVGYTIVDATCVAIVALIVMSPEKGWTRRLLEAPAFVYIGQISYGLYLLHLPVIAIIHPLASHHLPYLQTGLPLIVVSSLATVVVATASWFAFERPILGFKDRWEYSKSPAAEPDASANGNDENQAANRKADRRVSAEAFTGVGVDSPS